MDMDLKSKLDLDFKSMTTPNNNSGGDNVNKD